MKLHDEVDAFSLLNGSASANGANGDANGMGAHASGRPRRGSMRKSFTGFDHLPSVEEMEQDTDHDYEYGSYHGRRLSTDEDQEMDRPSTADTGNGESPLSAGSPSDGDAEDGCGPELGRCTGKTEALQGLAQVLRQY